MAENTRSTTDLALVQVMQGGGVELSIGPERPINELAAYHQTRGREPTHTVSIAPFMWDGRLVRVASSPTSDRWALEELAVRFGLAAEDTITPLGMVYHLSPYGAQYGLAQGVRVMLYFERSRETIDFCLSGTLEPADEGWWFKPERGAGHLHFSGPYFRRQLVPFRWETLDALGRLALQEKLEDERHQEAVGQIRAERQLLYETTFRPYEAGEYNRQVEDPWNRGLPKLVAGTLWVNGRDEVAVLVAVWGHPDSTLAWAELLYPDGRRRRAYIYLERWTPLPVWPQLHRVQVLKPTLLSREEGQYKAVVQGVGHFPSGGRHRDPWTMPVELSHYEFAVRLAAALGWVAPTQPAVGLDGELVQDPDFQPGQWIQVTYRRARRWAQICRIDRHLPYGQLYHPDPSQDRRDFWVRDTTGRLSVVSGVTVRTLNTAGVPRFLAGPVTEGIPASPALYWVDEAPAPAALTCGPVSVGD